MSGKKKKAVRWIHLIAGGTLKKKMHEFEMTFVNAYTAFEVDVDNRKSKLHT